MTTEAKFTPGPWHFAEVWRPSMGLGVPESERRDAHGNIFWGYSISGSNENGGAILPTLAAVHNFPDNMLANANLIAAAPDLYALAEAVAEHFDGTDAPLGQRARAALSRARGGDNDRTD